MKKLVLLSFLWLLANAARAQETDQKLAGHLSRVNSLAYSPDGKRLVSSADDRTLKIWDLQTGRVLHTMTGHTEEVRMVCFSPDGTLIASSSYDGSIRLWNSETGKQTRILKQGARYLLDAGFSPDGKQLVAGGSDFVCVWEVATGQVRFKLSQETASSVCFSPDGTQIAASDYNGKFIRLWDSTTGHQLDSLAVHRRTIYSVRFSPDGRTLATACGNDTVRFWSVRTGKLVSFLAEKGLNLSQVVFSPDGQHIALHGSWKGYLGDLKTTPRLIREAAVVTMGTAAFSPDGKQIAYAGHSGTITLASAQDYKTQRELPGISPGAEYTAFSPDASEIATAYYQYIFFHRISSLGSARPVYIRWPKGYTSTLAYSTDGKQLAVGADSLVRLYAVADGRSIDSLASHKAKVLALAFSPGGKYLASGDEKSGLNVWASQSGRLLNSTYIDTTGNTGGIKALAFSSDDAQIVLATTTGAIQLRHTNTKVIIQQAKADIPVQSMAFTPDNKYIITQGQDHIIVVRDPVSLTVLQRFDDAGFFADSLFTPISTPDRQYAILPYFGSFFLKKVAPTNPSVAINRKSAQPVITIQTPVGLNATVNTAIFTVKACIQGQGVTTCQLYLNSEPVSSRGLRRGSACPNAVDESITLLPGKNTLYITATNAGGTTTSDTRTITYNAPAVAVTAPKQQRLALVIGNACYTHAGVLANPVNDALAMKSALQECGFEVMYYTDLDKRGMATAFTDFGQKLKQYNVGLAFYAGHGVSVRGRNYFLPVDANPQTEDEVEFEGVETLRLIRKMEEANRLTNIVMLDACRDNPFARSWGRSLAESGGFALMSPPRGTFIAQSASEGQQASDRIKSGSNSPFTKALVKYIRQSGLSLTQILFRVRQAVEQETDGRQLTEDSNKLMDDFYFSR